MKQRDYRKLNVLMDSRVNDLGVHMVQKTPLQLSVAFAATLLGVSGFTASSATLHHASGQIIGIAEQGSARAEGVVVSLTEVPGTFAPPAAAVSIDQKDKEFFPTVLAILKGTKVAFNNSDPFFHNVFSSSRVKTFNVSQEKKGDSSEILFDKAGIIPIRCHIHANMKGYVVVLPNPYFAVTNSKGLFRIANVPAGTYTIKAWSASSGSVTQTVEVPASGEAKIIFKLGS